MTARPPISAVPPTTTPRPKSRAKRVAKTVPANPSATGSSVTVPPVPAASATVRRAMAIASRSPKSSRTSPASAIADKPAPPAREDQRPPRSFPRRHAARPARSTMAATPVRRARISVTANPSATRSPSAAARARMATAPASSATSPLSARSPTLRAPMAGPARRGMAGIDRPAASATRSHTRPVAMPEIVPPAPIRPAAKAAIVQPAPTRPARNPPTATRSPTAPVRRARVAIVRPVPGPRSGDKPGGYTAGAKPRLRRQALCRQALCRQSPAARGPRQRCRRQAARPAEAAPVTDAHRFRQVPRQGAALAHR